MSATQIQLSTGLTTTLSKANNSPYAAGNAGPTSQTFSLAGINLANWDQVYLGTYTLFTGVPTGPAATLTAGGTLTVSTQYFYKITAVGFAGVSGTEETQGSTEVSATPTSGNQSIVLTWTAVSGAVSYNIYRGTVTNTENLLVGNVTQSVTPRFTDTGFAGSSATPPGSAAPTFIEFDLSSYTNLASEAATAGHVLGILVTNTGTVGTSQCTLAPGTTNGLTWFFGGTTPTIDIPINGIFLLCGPATGSAGQVIDSTHKTLRVTNGGSATTTFSVAAITGP